MASGASIRGPKGTRDLYPEDVLRQRYIQKAWRDTAIRHGFDEIEGPTFESSELYAVKSGEGILGELFQAFSGKDPAEVECVKESGRGPYALRPEFTPTLARMYAARAKQLPQPCRWFTAGPYFRAERPQRGRLREFLQWNVDVVGGEAKEQGSAEVIAVAVGMLESLGLTPGTLRIKLGSRDAVLHSMTEAGIDESKREPVLALLDARPKLGGDKYIEEAAKLGLPDAFVRRHHPEHRIVMRLDDTVEALTGRYPGLAKDRVQAEQAIARQAEMIRAPGSLQHALVGAGLGHWCEFDSMIVRGLAYYTGTVFEAIAGNERAVCGGGRYDNLIELFGGPETPAVGFGMGDVVLGLLLDDNGLMPEGRDLAEALSMPPASIRPDVFVIAANDEAAEAVAPVLALLRRTESMLDAPKVGLHARTSSRATRNVGKLLKEAAACHARFAVILENGREATVKDMDRAEQDPAPRPISTLRETIKARL